MHSSTDQAPSALPITPALLREWQLPRPGGSKYSRGQVVIVGADPRSPGAVLLAGESSLRVGGGRLTIAVSPSVATQMAVALPECGVVPLEETAKRSVRGTSVALASSDLSNADAVLVGPGLADADEVARLLQLLPDLISDRAIVVLDAFALGVLPRIFDDLRSLDDRLVLTPNKAEAERLADAEIDDVSEALPDLARAYHAVISCQSYVASPSGGLWSVGAGNPGLATSGSGDVLAGAIVGLAARGAAPDQAAAWGTYLHATAGDNLATRVGGVGFLARDLAPELSTVLASVTEAPA